MKLCAFVGEVPGLFVIAHRGANRFAPQNTIHAFRKAIEQRSDGVETDVHLTKDGHLVLCHDPSVNRTSDGRGRISDLLLSELREFDFGGWFGSRFRDTRIPTFDEFLRMIKDSALPLMDIELKPQRNRAGFVKSVLDKVAEYGLTDKLFVSSFDPTLLAEVKQLNPAVKTGFLYPGIGELRRSKSLSPLKVAELFQIDYLLPHRLFATEGLIKRAHRAGRRVGVWTVNQLDTVEKLIRWGADGIITDMPDVVRNKIESY